MTSPAIAISAIRTNTSTSRQDQHRCNRRPSAQREFGPHLGVQRQVHQRDAISVEDIHAFYRVGYALINHGHVPAFVTESRVTATSDDGTRWDLPPTQEVVFPNQTEETYLEGSEGGLARGDHEVPWRLWSDTDGHTPARRTRPAWLSMVTTAKFCSGCVAAVAWIAPLIARLSGKVICCRPVEREDPWRAHQDKLLGVRLVAREEGDDARRGKPHGVARPMVGRGVAGALRRGARPEIANPPLRHSPAAPLASRSHRARRAGVS
jgi:hypothetical protein